MKIPNLNNVKNVINVGKAFVIAHRPELLFGASVAATVGSTVLAAKGGYEARGKVADAEMERVMSTMSDEAVQELECAVNDPENRLTTKEKAELTWQCYLPSAFALTTAVGSTTGLHLVHVKDKKALVQASAVALEEAKQMYKHWEQEIVDSMSDEEHRSIQDRIHEKNYDPEKGAATMVSSDGVLEEMYIVRDGKTGREIWSNENRIEKAVIDLNNVLNGQGDCELNTFYQYAGFPAIPEGEEAGWSGALVEVDWKDSHREDGRPVREFFLRPFPEKGYNSAFA